MYEAFFGFSERPFSLLPDPEFLYLGDTHSTAYTMLEYSLLSNAGFTVVTGEIGSGKTTLVRHLLNQLDEGVTVGLISNTHRSFGGLLQWILMAYGLEYRSMEKAELYETFVNFVIQEYAKGQRTILIVDEAQNMDPDSLEDLRLMSNINADKDQLFQLILVGQPGLRQKLKDAALVQFAHRIAVDYHLEPLSADETSRYIAHRLSVAGGVQDLFEPEACKLLHKYSGGIPRLVNLLCDAALAYAFGSQERHVSTTLVEEVVKDKSKGGLLDYGRRKKSTSRSDGAIDLIGRTRRPKVRQRVFEDPQEVSPLPTPSQDGESSGPALITALTEEEMEVERESNETFRELFKSLRED